MTTGPATPDTHIYGITNTVTQTTSLQRTRSGSDEEGEEERVRLKLKEECYPYDGHCWTYWHERAQEEYNHQNSFVSKLNEWRSRVQEAVKYAKESGNTAKEVVEADP